MYAGDPKVRAARVTVPQLRQMKTAGRRIAALTAYDAAFAAVLDAQGVDVVLVGDSLGMVVQGRDSTVPVSVEDIVYHCACVARGLQRGLLVADMPFLSYATPSRALDAAARLLQGGAATMVKLEGAGPMLETIRTLSERDVPVCAHLGLTPQSILKLGGFKVQGRDAEVANRLREDALSVQDAGADLLVLECVPRALAGEITRSLAIPTIGIGAGAECDGQILVLHDLLGIDTGHRRPRFVKDFLAEGGSIAKAIAAYVEAVRSGAFPDAEHGYD
jgi:3-methyl-2-oxobutanoate hydroxymethyltransferase